MTAKRGEGSIYQRQDGRWCAQLMVSGKPKHFYGGSRRDVYYKLVTARMEERAAQPMVGYNPSAEAQLVWCADNCADVTFAPGRVTLRMTSYPTIIADSLESAIWSMEECKYQRSIESEIGAQFYSAEGKWMG